MTDQNTTNEPSVEVRKASESAKQAGRELMTPKAVAELLGITDASVRTARLNGRVESPFALSITQNKVHLVTVRSALAYWVGTDTEGPINISRRCGATEPRWRSAASSGTSSATIRWTHGPCWARPAHRIALPPVHSKEGPIMTTPQPRLKSHCATVRITGDIDYETVNQCVTDVDALLAEYNYPRIELHIDSNGGSAAAMTYLIEAFDRWRNSCQVDTRVLTHAGSAAALMLSLGDLRQASHSSMLLYHHTRIAPRTGQTLTASRMDAESRQLAELDTLMRQRLVERACRVDRRSWLAHLDSQEPPAPDAAIVETRFCDCLFGTDRTTGNRDRDATRMESQMLRSDGGNLPAAPNGEAPDRSGSQPVAADHAATLATCMASVLRSETEDSLPERLLAIYANLMHLDCQITALDAKSLGLVDVVGDEDAHPLAAPPFPARDDAPDACLPVCGGDSLWVPEWRAIHPNGVAIKTLLRHTLILGETGSGKTASGILPIVRAAVGAMKGPNPRVGCLLVVDPKRDIGPVLDAFGDVDVRRLALTPQDETGERFQLDLMAGTPVDLSAPDLRQAAEDILGKAASLCASNPMQTLVGSNQSTSRNQTFWDQLGAELGLLFLELALILLRRFEETGQTEVSCENEPRERAVRRFLELRDDGRNVLTLANHLLSAWGGATDFIRMRRSVPDLCGSHPRNDDSQVKRWLERIAPFEQHAHTGDRLWDSIVGSTLGCFLEFCARDIAQTLYFGCEPATRHPSGCLDLAQCVATEVDRPHVLLVQPDLTRTESALVAKALKAGYFAAVLRDPVRRGAGGGDNPLVGYVADEFHRFATADLRHGEQSFLDTCRSFGAFCVLATQSVSSLEHALSEIGTGSSTEPAIQILVNNTATKLQFRTTDQKSRRVLDGLFPNGRWGPLPWVRPASTLKPGECYAVLADGRVARRQLGWVDADKLAAESKGS